MDFNQKQYNQHFQEYLESNKDAKIGGYSPQKRIELLKKFLPVGRTVLEIGSGGGTDALLLQQAGYNVIASDYVEEFVNILKNKGLNTVVLDAKHDELPAADAAYANAVFVHFSPEETVDFLKRAKGKLQNEKIVFLSVIKGEGYERSARNRGFERDFYYYTKESLGKLLTENGFSIKYLDDSDSKWLQIICSAN